MTDVTGVNVAVTEMARLRIYRTWEWVSAVPMSEIRMGGDNPMKLVHRDELQYAVLLYSADHSSPPKVEWVPLEIVEAEKPEHPREAKLRKQSEKRTQYWKDNPLPVFSSFAEMQAAKGCKHEVEHDHWADGLGNTGWQCRNCKASFPDDPKE